MDEFVLGIDKEKFRSTNAKWNELMLNDGSNNIVVFLTIQYYCLSLRHE